MLYVLYYIVLTKLSRAIIFLGLEIIVDFEKLTRSGVRVGHVTRKGKKENKEERKDTNKSFSNFVSTRSVSPKLKGYYSLLGVWDNLN